MNEYLYERAKAIFVEVCDLPRDEQAARVAELCGKDEMLRAEVEAYLESYRATGEFPELSAAALATIAATPARRTEPDRIGPYRIEHELGSGGMGVVYLAVRDDASLRRRVAIKVLRRGMDSDRILERFSLERQLLATLNHECIARLLTADETEDGQPYFVMEYVDGQPIDTYCDERRLSIDERLELFMKVCDAVHHAHQKLVIHRDIKPGNIIVTEDGTPKLLDFGIAKMTNPEYAPVMRRDTEPELRVMTPEYASPEQIRGGPLATTSDVYSLGVLLYELLSGHPPYEIKSRLQAEIERVVCEEEPERPSTAVTRSATREPTNRRPSTTPEGVSRARSAKPDQVRKRLEGDIDNIVLKAMRKEAQRRYSTAAALAEDIKLHLQGLPVSARPDTWSYRAGKFMKRNRRLVVASAAVAVVLLGSWTALVASWATTQTVQQRADKAEFRSEQAEGRAEEAEGRAQQAADSAEAAWSEVILSFDVVMDAHDVLRPFPGSISSRDVILRSIAARLEAMALQSPDRVDQAHAICVASVELKLGEVQGGRRTHSRGNKAKAREHYDRAMAVLDEMESVEPLTPRAKSLRADLHIAIADTLGDAWEERHARYMTAADVRRSASDAEYFGALTSLASLEMDWADASPDRREELRASARRRIGDAIAGYERLIVEGAPDDRRDDLVVAVGDLARWEYRYGSIDDAMREYSRLLSLAQELVDRNRDNTRYVRRLANAHWYLVNFGTNVLADDVRAQHADEALRHYSHVLNADPLSERSQRENLMSLRFVAMTRSDDEEAIGAWRAVATEAARVAARDPLDPSTHDELMQCHYFSAKELVAVDPVEALQILDRVRDRANEMYAAGSSDRRTFDVLYDSVREAATVD